jgi:hypothetical protein
LVVLFLGLLDLGFDVCALEFGNNSFLSLLYDVSASYLAGSVDYFYSICCLA